MHRAPETIEAEFGPPHRRIHKSIVLPAILYNLDEAKRLFSYARISAPMTKQLHDSEGNFCSLNDSRKAFIFFGHIQDDLYYPHIKTDFSKRRGGWKLHIAIDDQNRRDGNVDRAWDLVKSVLIDYRIGDSKVIKSGISFHGDETQCGKQITIYVYISPDRNWKTIVTEIERVLTSSPDPIRPGKLSPGDALIEGSRFITYRNDDHQKEKRIITASEAIEYSQANGSTSYNPFKLKGDPFLEFKIVL